MKRNTAGQIVTAQLNALADGTPVTGGTTTVTVVKDGIGAASTGTIAHVNGGLWKYSPSQTETDAAHLAFVFTNTLAGSQTPQMYTEVDVNLIKINNTTLPVDNLELQYNTVGLTGDSFPASQAQLSQISSGSGGISITSTGVVVTTGIEAGAYTSTFALDGVYHSFTPSVGVIDIYYETHVGNNGVATSVLWEGYIQSNNDAVNVFAWDWVGSAWVQVDTIFGSTGVSPFSETFILSSNMTGLGANKGKVRLRFESSDANVIATDRILFEYTSIADTSFIMHSGIAQAGSANTITLDIGASVNDGSYINSRVITVSGTGSEQESIITDYNGTTKVATIKQPWVVNPNNTTEFNITPAHSHAATTAGGYDNSSVFIDVANGVAGTLVGVNGTSGNPALTLADAKTIADKLNLNRFTFDRGIGLPTLDQDYLAWKFLVRSPIAFDMGNRDVSSCTFDRATLTGTCTNNTGVAVYEVCGLLDVDCGISNFIKCGLVGSLTMSQSGAVYNADEMWSNSSTGLPPQIIFNSNGVSGITFEASISGRYIVKGMKPLDVLQVMGDGEFELDSTCNGGTVISSGDIRIIDNSTTSPTFTSGLIKQTKDVVDSVLTDTGTTIPAQIDALNDFNPATDTVANVTLVGTTTTNTDMVGTDNALLASSYTAPDNTGIANIEVKVDNIPTVTEFNARTLPSADYFDSSSDGVDVISLLGTSLTETTGTRLANNLSFFFDNGDANTTKVVDDVGSAVSGGGEFTALEKNQMRFRLGMDGVSAVPTASPDLSQFNPVTDTVANVTLVGTTTTNTDMVGTDNALLASSYTAPDNTGIADIEVKVDALNDFNPATDTVANVTLVGTTTTNTDMVGTDNALLASNYTAPDNTGIADIETKVDAILTDTSVTIPSLIVALENLSAAEVKAQVVEALTVDNTGEPISVPSETAPLVDKLSYLFAFAANKISQTATTQTLRNKADTLNISSATVSSNGVTTNRGVHT